MNKAEQKWVVDIND